MYSRLHLLLRVWLYRAGTPSRSGLIMQAASVGCLCVRRNDYAGCIAAACAPCCAQTRHSIQLGFWRVDDCRYLVAAKAPIACKSFFQFTGRSFLHGPYPFSPHQVDLYVIRVRIVICIHATSLRHRHNVGRVFDSLLVTNSILNLDGASVAICYSVACASF
jgi:hypothetical protein